MNDQWRPGISGGEIVLNPFPYPEVTIPPCFDRLVLFSSSEMLHRVLPSHEPRYCLTFWMYGHERDNDEFMKKLAVSLSPTTTSVIEKFSATNLAPQQEESAQLDEFVKSSLLEEAHAMNLMLSGSSNRKYFNRLAYASEWRQSIIESHFKNSSSSSSSSSSPSPSSSGTGGSGSKQHQHQLLLEEALERNDKEVQVILKSFASFLNNQNYKYSNIASNPLELIKKYIPVSPTDQPGLVDWFPTHAR
jgi:hypothetical protein